MGRGQSQTLTDYPELDESSLSSPSSRWGDHTTARSSRMGHVMTSIRRALAHEQERLFSHPDTSLHEQNQLKRAEQSEIVVSDQDEMKPSFSNERRPSETCDDLKGSISPAIEAFKSFEANENNMGPESHQKPATWGWPGLGTYPEPEKYPSTSQTGTKTQKVAALEPRFEAATFEAIDNAAESEFGWPGIGTWPRSRK